MRGNILAVVTLTTVLLALAGTHARSSVLEEDVPATDTEKATVTEEAGAKEITTLDVKGLDLEETDQWRQSGNTWSNRREAVWREAVEDGVTSSCTAGMDFFMTCCRACTRASAGSGKWSNDGGSNQWNSGGGSGQWNNGGGSGKWSGSGSNKWNGGGNTRYEEAIFEEDTSEADENYGGGNTWNSGRKWKTQSGLPSGLLDVGRVISCKFRCTAHALLIRWQVFWARVSQTRTALLILYKTVLRINAENARDVQNPVNKDLWNAESGETTKACTTCPLPTGKDGDAIKRSIPSLNADGSGTNACVQKADGDCGASDNCYVLYNATSSPFVDLAPDCPPDAPRTVKTTNQTVYADLLWDTGVEFKLDLFKETTVPAGSFDAKLDGFAVKIGALGLEYRLGANFFALCRTTRLQLTCLKSVTTCYEKEFKYTCPIEEIFGSGIYLLVAAYLCICDPEVYNMYGGMNSLGKDFSGTYHWPKEISLAQRLLESIRSKVTSPLNMGTLAFVGFAAGVLVFAVAKFTMGRIRRARKDRSLEEVADGYTSLI